MSSPLRLLSFWLGLPVLLFLLWAWSDSMRHSAVLNLAHGKTFNMVWPPVDPMEKLPGLPAPPIAPAEPDFELPRLEVPSFGDLKADPPYYNPSIPSSQQMPLLPIRNRALLPDDLYRSARTQRMQPYYSIGSKEGVVWLSSWISPEMPKPAVSSYLPELSSGTWFPALEQTHNERLQSSTLRIPYWMILSAYALGWLAVLAWRGARQKKRLALMEAAVPSASE
jgi:hypothetical protein